MAASPHRDRHTPHHPLVELARRTVEQYIRTGSKPKAILEHASADEVEEFNRERAGVFVSLKIEGELRGCIGTFAPTTKSIADETVRNAIFAATEDPRFPPVGEHELHRLTYSVDVLTPPESVTDLSTLDPKRYGIIIRAGHRRGLLLPDLEGVDTVQEQIRITRRKAGISPDEDISVERFEVKRFQ